jgi:hypothetical protein
MSENSEDYDQKPQRNCTFSCIFQPSKFLQIEFFNFHFIEFLGQIRCTVDLCLDGGDISQSGKLANIC